MRNLDLWAVTALAAAGVVAQLGPAPAPLRAVLGVLLVLVCPGYALAAALFRGRALGRLEQGLLGLGLGLAVAILGAVALNWLPGGLQTGAWAGLFFVVTLGASLVAARRVEPRPAPAGQRLPPLRRDHWIWLGLAGGLTVAAVLVARLPGPVTGVVGYTALWMVPDSAPSGAPDTSHVQLGVISSEFTTTHYQLQVKVDNRVILDKPDITLAPGGTWQLEMPLPAGQPGGTAEALLYRLDDPNSVYRSVLLRRQQEVR